MKTSPNGIKLIKRFEGCRLTAYRDLVGVWTIGYGHTSMAGAPTVKPEMVITAAEAEAMLVRDLVKYENGVEAALKRIPTHNQFDAMVSLCYNIGIGGFSKSSIVRRFNEGDIEGAANSFLLWKKAGGAVVQGLVNRRNAERELFLKETETIPVTDYVPAPTVTNTPSLWEKIKAWFKWKEA